MKCCAIYLIFLLSGLARTVDAGRKGGNSGVAGQREEEATELPTSEYFFHVDNDELIRNFTVVEGSLKDAEIAVSNQQSRYNNDQGDVELCTYCRAKVGNSTTDLECRDNERKICWASTGCYRLTFRDLTTQHYHIEKGCWNENFSGMYGKCMKKCGIKREGLPDPEERINCYCELCHGPMCNREILTSSTDLTQRIHRALVLLLVLLAVRL